MSYSNQRDHDFLDRQTIRDLLQQLATAQVVTAPAQLPRPEHLRQLMRLAGSQLEVRWLQWMEDLDLRLPTAAQTLVEACHTRPDFLYENHQAAICVDRPAHDFPERQARDLAVHETMEDYGYTVIRFAHDGDWMEKVRAYPHVFGTPAPQRPAPAAVGEEGPGLDLDLFPQAWHAVLAALATDQAVTVEPGGDVTQGGRVVGQYVAELAASGTTATLVDSRADNVAAIIAALQAQGRNVIQADPTAEDALAQIGEFVA